MEHFRTMTHQFYDTEKYVIMDTVTGELERGYQKDTVMSFEEAKEEFETMMDQWVGRRIIIKLDCIQGVKL